MGAERIILSRFAIAHLSKGRRSSLSHHFLLATRSNERISESMCSNKRISVSLCSNKRISVSLCSNKMPKTSIRWVRVRKWCQRIVVAIVWTYGSSMKWGHSRVARIAKATILWWYKAMLHQVSLIRKTTGFFPPLSRSAVAGKSIRQIWSGESARRKQRSWNSYSASSQPCRMRDPRHGNFPDKGTSSRSTTFDAKWESWICKW